MKRPCKNPQNDELLEKLMGLGDRSIQKSYYPLLQKKIEELEEEKKKYESIFHNAFNGIIRLNKKGEILGANPVMEHMTGFPDSGLEGVSFPGELMVSPEDWPLIIEKIYSDNSPKNHIIELKHKNSKRIWISANILKSENRDDIVEIFCENISDRKRMEEELRHRQKMDAVGQLAAGIAHDFNNILTGILGSSELLINHVEKDYEKFVKTIIYSAERAGELVSKLLTFSRKNKVEHKEFNIHSIIENTINLLERSIDKKIVISKELLANNFTIKGDTSLIQNALLNLGINAKDAMPGGGILTYKTNNRKIDSRLIKYLPYEIAPGDYIEIHVEDTGTGIPKNIVSKIFDPFFTTKEQGKGTGLGLSSVYGTIKNHEGIISVYSEPRKGTSFSILLPLSNSKPEKTDKESKIQKQGGRILLADDEEIIRQTAPALLEILGYDVVTAENGFEAVKIYKKDPKKFDIIILDMIMPLMDGKDTFYELRKLNPGAKVIISSGLSKHKDIRELKEHGLCGFLKKPYERSELSRVIASAINHSHPAEPL